VGTFGGVLTLGLMNNLLNLFGVQPFYQRILKGLIIIVSVLARRRER
jgi:ribose transport system permease protein